MKILSCIIIIIFGVISCNSINVKNYDLKDDEILLNFFSQNEINFILSFTDSVISKSYYTSNIGESYHNYCNYLISSSNEEFYLKLNKDSANYNSFINSINRDSIFNNIWEVEEVVNRDRTKIIEINLTINSAGKYLKFLKLFSSFDNRFKDYYEGIISMGNIGPSSMLGLITNHQLFDFNNQSYRFIIAIHLISIKYKQKY